MRPTIDGFSPALQAAWSSVVNLSSSHNIDDLPPDLVRNVLALWQRFTKDSSAGTHAYMDQAECLRAYLAYYFPVNAAKVLNLLAEMPQPEIRGDKSDQCVNVLDMGCGPGTAALAILDWTRSCSALSSANLHVVAVDVSQSALDSCAQLWDSYREFAGHGPETLTTVQVDLQRKRSKIDSRYGTRSYDLIVAANTLNELFRDQAGSIELRATFVRRLLELLDAHGTLMIIEPALRETSRNLHLVRDIVLAAGGCHVYSPCLHDQACPALLKKDDWCHEERPWEPPGIVGAIDRRVGFIKDSLKFSYLLLRKDGRHIVPRATDLYRVVSELRKMKGEQRAWLCHENGRPEIGRLDRECSAANAQFDDWHRGAIVRVGDLPHEAPSRLGDRLTRIRKTTAVELVRRTWKD